MEDSNKKCGDGCGCGGRSKGCGCGSCGCGTLAMMGCGMGSHSSLMRIVFVIAILGFIFWWGVQMGEMKSRLHGGDKWNRGGYYPVTDMNTDPYGDPSYENPIPIDSDGLGPQN